MKYGGTHGTLDSDLVSSCKCYLEMKKEPLSAVRLTQGSILNFVKRDSL